MGQKKKKPVKITIYVFFYNSTKWVWTVAPERAHLFRVGFTSLLEKTSLIGTLNTTEQSCTTRVGLWCGVWTKSNVFRTLKVASNLKTIVNIYNSSVAKGTRSGLLKH